MKVGTCGTVVLAGLVAFTLGCEPGKKDRGAPTPLDHTTTGAISGTVRLEGPKPAQTQLQLSSVADCASQHEGPVYAGDVLVEDGKVQNAIVYIKEGLGDRVFAVPTTPVEIDQKGCLFVPRVAAAQTDQPVRFLNSDSLAHNVRGDSFNFSLGLRGASRTVEVDTPSAIVELKCDIHPWMRAWLGVFDHPYFAVTGPDGAFKLEEVPPGDYVVEAWHERFGTQTTKVTLGPKDTKTTELVFQK